MIHVAVKIVVLTVVAIIACWGCSLVLDAWRYGTQERIASRIIRGETFSTDFISSLALKAPRGDNVDQCNATVARSTAVIDVSGLEEAYASADRQAIDDRLQKLEASTRFALACAPTDAFLWCIRYWVKVIKYGFKREFLIDLELSYDFGPNEGWIAAKRNNLALAVFDQLGPSVQDLVVAEFAGMVDAGLIERSANNLVGVVPALQDRLLSALSGSRPISREWLAKWLRKEGYRVNVPGVELPEERPWR
jgi:hypothetical protein